MLELNNCSVIFNEGAHLKKKRWMIFQSTSSLENS